MTDDILREANHLSRKIKEVENQILAATSPQTCTSVEFAYNHGPSGGWRVCTDEGTIRLVRDLIVRENEAKLARLKQEFAKLWPKI